MRNNHSIYCFVQFLHLDAKVSAFSIKLSSPHRADDCISSSTRIAFHHYCAHEGNTSAHKGITSASASTMSLVNLSHVCSHLQNASKARLGLTSVPNSNLILSLMLALQTNGFFSFVTRGGPSPPIMLSPTSVQPLEPPEPVTQVNVASRRLWLGLKYWNNEPVLSKMSMLSKPTKRVWMDAEGLGKLVRGHDANYIKGMRRPGECVFVTTDKGVMEARECVDRRIGGMLLCRAL